MKHLLRPVAVAILAGCIAALVAPTSSATPPEPKFTAVTLDDHVQIGYGLAIADVDGDGLPDILLADKKQFVWYRNPGRDQSRNPAAWHKYLLAENLTPEDNVCIAAQDINGTGKCEIAVGAAWNPSDTEHSGAVFYLAPPVDRTQPWTPIRFPEVEPTTHRMRWIRLNDGSWGLLVLPLHGRGNKNGEGNPVKAIVYHPPSPMNDPKGEWRAETIELGHMTHNFNIIPRPNVPAVNVVFASKEGIHFFTRDKRGSWTEGGQGFTRGTPDEPQPAGEIRRSRFGGQLDFYTSIEPMHGNNLVVYVSSERSPSDTSGKPYRAQVLTDRLVEGHALGVGDLLGMGAEQIVVGWRGKAGTTDTSIGLSLWTPLDPKGEKWRESSIDPDGMACEDLQLADLDGDGHPEIIASGRRTHNLKIYFNDVGR